MQVRGGGEGGRGVLPAPLQSTLALHGLMLLAADRITSRVTVYHQSNNSHM